jgi:hypothetical protein
LLRSQLGALVAWLLGARSTAALVTHDEEHLGNRAEKISSLC